MKQRAFRASGLRTPSLQGRTRNPKHHRSVDGQRGRSPTETGSLLPMAGRIGPRRDPKASRGRRMQPAGGGSGGLLEEWSLRMEGRSPWKPSGGWPLSFFLCIDRESSSANRCSAFIFFFFFLTRRLVWVNKNGSRIWPFLCRSNTVVTNY
jgi:hypothetical protein